jgi:ABC-type glycerol-3-phosphate transport system substrate-binding protein
MLRTPTATLALLAALALGACGGDDSKDSGGASTADQPAKTQTQTQSTAGGGSRKAEIVSCLKKAGLNVIVNPGSTVDADYQLVINGGGGGVLYGYADSASAQANKAKVQKYEGSSQRKTEVIQETVYAYFPAGQTLAEPEKSAKVRKCAA